MKTRYNIIVVGIYNIIPPVRKSAKLWKIIQTISGHTPASVRIYIYIMYTYMTLYINTLYIHIIYYYIHARTVIYARQCIVYTLIWPKKSYCLCPGCFIAVARTRQHNSPEDPGDVNSQQARFRR